MSTKGELIRLRNLSLKFGILKDKILESERGFFSKRRLCKEIDSVRTDIAHEVFQILRADRGVDSVT